MTLTWILTMFALFNIQDSLRQLKDRQKERENKTRSEMHNAYLEWTEENDKLLERARASDQLNGNEVVELIAAMKENDKKLMREYCNP